MSAEAVRMAELAGDDRSLALALHARHSALWHPDFTDERTAIARRLVAQSREADDFEGSLIYRAGLIADLAEVGSRAELAREVESFSRDARSSGQPDSMWLAPMFESTMALMAGDFGRATELAVELQELGSRVGSEDAQTCWAAQTTMTSFELGAGPKVIDNLQDHAANHPNVFRLFRAAPAWAAAEFGETQSAREHLKFFADSAFETIPKDMNWLGSLTILAMASAELEEVAWSAHLYEMLRPYAHRCAVLGYNVIFLGSIATHVAGLGSVCGRHGEAQHYFAQGLRANEEIGAQPWVIRSRYAQGRATARSGDLAGARALLEQARADAQELGMTHIANRCGAALAALRDR